MDFPHFPPLSAKTTTWRQIKKKLKRNSVTIPNTAKTHLGSHRANLWGIFFPPKPNLVFWWGKQKGFFGGLREGEIPSFRLLLGL